MAPLYSATETRDRLPDFKLGAVDRSGFAVYGKSCSEIVYYETELNSELTVGEVGAAFWAKAALAMALTFEFLFDSASPFSHLADTQAAELSGGTGAELTYGPIVPGAVFKETANASPLSTPAKERCTGTELARRSARHRLPFKMNPFFPITRPV